MGRERSETQMTIMNIIVCCEVTTVVIRKKTEAIRGASSVLYKAGEELAWTANGSSSKQ